MKESGCAGRRSVAPPPQRRFVLDRLTAASPNRRSIIFGQMTLGPTTSPKIRWAINAVLLAAAYISVAWVGLRYAVIGGSISPVWPPTGVALAALLLLGPQYWPAIFCGAFVANATTGVPLIAAGGIACGNAAEAVLGAYLHAPRRGDRGVALDDLPGVRALVLIAAPLSALAGAAVGVTSLSIAGALPQWSLARVRVWSLVGRGLPRGARGCAGPPYMGNGLGRRCRPAPSRHRGGPVRRWLYSRRRAGPGPAVPRVLPATHRLPVPALPVGDRGRAQDRARAARRSRRSRWRLSPSATPRAAAVRSSCRAYRVRPWCSSCTSGFLPSPA